MPRAVLRNGVIYPLEPLPPEWADGKELQVEVAPEVEGQEDSERHFQELEELVSAIPPEDIERMNDALALADEQAKTIVRREMGLD
jgi:hypothetical protein